MPDILQLWFPNVVARFPEFFDSFVQTLIMVGISGLASFVLATFLAVVLTVTKTGGLAPNPIVFNIIDKIINLFRSIPFIILAAALVSVTRALVGTAIGTKGAIFPPDRRYHAFLHQADRIVAGWSGHRLHRSSGGDGHGQRGDHIPHLSS
jgi:D-methionine transport system permease protein